MVLNDLQISAGNWHTGLTQATHLSNFFLTEPALASEVVVRVYNKMNGYKNALSFLTTGTGRTKELDNIVYRWPLMGDSEKAVPISVAQSTYNDGGSTPGINRSTFRVGLPEKWFAYGDVLVPDDTQYALRVMDEPISDGVDYVYTLQLVTKDPTAYVPQSLLAVGKELSKDYNIVEHDHSRTGGDTTYATPFMMENYMSTYRKMYSVSGAAQSKVLRISLMSPTGKETASTWIKYAEWQFWAEWMDEMEKAYIYGKGNVAKDGTTGMKGKYTGNVIYTGAGLEEQIAPANKRYYTSLTEGVLRDFMDDLAYNGTVDGPREYVALCGRQFMNEFDKAMKRSAAAFTLTDSKFISGSGQELSLGGQFKTYTGLNGDKIILKECPLYNDVVRNRQLHPQTGKPVESYKATFLNFKMNGGESNVQKVYHKGREMSSTYIEGMCSPFGMKKGGTSSTPVDGYEFHVLSECGIMLKDPTDSGQLILDVANIS
jgi:hypothetical protein